jgi:hypothetical protein
MGAFAPYAGRYELALNVAVCTISAVLVERAARAGQVVWACGLGAMAIAASPLLLVDRIFLLLAFACIVSTLVAIPALRPQPVAVLS